MNTVHAFSPNVQLPLSDYRTQDISKSKKLQNPQ